MMMMEVGSSVDKTSLCTAAERTLRYGAVRCDAMLCDAIRCGYSSVSQPLLARSKTARVTGNTQVLAFYV